MATSFRIRRCLHAPVSPVQFDEVTIKYGLYKVEIIGDAYFVVGGCPEQCDDHAERCAAAALEMLDFMPLLREIANADISMRVGMHCGPTIAGVVGIKDPRYSFCLKVIAIQLLPVFGRALPALIVALYSFWFYRPCPPMLGSAPGANRAKNNVVRDRVTVTSVALCPFRVSAWRSVFAVQGAIRFGA